jgi:hypothetical protein
VIDTSKTIYIPAAIDSPQVVEHPEAAGIDSPSGGAESPEVLTCSAPVDDGVLADEELYIYPQETPGKVCVFFSFTSSD